MMEPICGGGGKKLYYLYSFVTISNSNEENWYMEK